MSVCFEGSAPPPSSRWGNSRKVLAGLSGKAALLGRWRFLPLLLLLAALSTVFFFSNDRGHFYRGGISENHLALAANISYEHNFLGFYRETLDFDGLRQYEVYNRFPIGGFLLIKLFILPFGDDLSAQIYAARVLMLLFFAGTAVLAFLSISRISSNRWMALAVTALAFSSYYWLYYNDMVATEVAPDLFGVMLVFHGMVIFAQEGRFRQLLIKACIALLLGWHVYALLLPFVVLGLAKEAVRVRSALICPPPPARGWLWRQWSLARLVAAAGFRSRYLALGVVALLFGMAVLGFNLVNEYLALDREVRFTELPSLVSILGRTGLDDAFVVKYPETLAWQTFLEGQFYRIGGMSIPYSLPGYANALGQWPSSPLGLQGVITGIVVSCVCLIGLVLVRHKLLLATLALSGFVWALPLRINTAFHTYEALIYTGIPLVFFLLVLLGIRKLSSDRLVAGLAVIGLLVFVMSSFQMARVGNDAETAEFMREVTDDFEVIRGITKGNTVMVQRNLFDSSQVQGLDSAVNYFLTGSVIITREHKLDNADFLLESNRSTNIGLLTPGNSHTFLYDRAIYEEWANEFIEVAGDPVIRSVFDVYLNEVGLVYVRDICSPDDTMDKFFLHIIPIDRNDLPIERSQYNFDNLDFYFEEYAIYNPGRCVAVAELPDYEIRSIRTGQVFRREDGSLEQTWGGSFDFPVR